MYKYPKSEKLCSKKLFEELIAANNLLHVYPLKIYWNLVALPESVQVQSAVSVSKRKFKHAVSRNLLKRRIREAFRLHKQPLYETLEQQAKQMTLLIVYNCNKILKYSEIEQALISLLTSLENEITSDVNP